MARLTRRELLVLVPAAAYAFSRQDLISRHSPETHIIDPTAPFSVGNGEFAFTADITGLQTLSELYDRGTPLCTQSQWGWHTSPISAGLDPTKLRLESYDTYGRQVGYATNAKGQERLFAWLRENPHRLNLARIGLLLDGIRPKSEDITNITQKLDLWTGILESRFQLRGIPVAVRTCCHPTQDVLGVSIATESPVTIAMDFPYASSEMNASDWSAAGRHRTTVISSARGTLLLDRELDSDRYSVEIRGRAEFEPPHRVVIHGNFTCRFAPQRKSEPMPSFDEVRAASASHWNKFWSTGGSIDLSGSTDPRAPELERRIVLSQYLTAIQCAGSSPPQETGLTCNSWFGKFHLEMHWWHSAHFALWNRTPLLERSLYWYLRILPSARERAAQQGYSGARWPKMTALDGRDSPSAIGPLLIWEQPHPISYAELCYRAHPNRATLNRFQDLVFETAEFMASFAVKRDGRYILGPPVIPAQENHPPLETWNPTFELVYWRDGLKLAQSWRERLGLTRSERWDDVIAGLSKLPQKDGVYLAQENCPQTFSQRNYDHPSMLYACGMLSGDGADRETMRRTLRKVFAEWRWADTWGWDFPAVAMTAARLGEPELATDALFLDSPKNKWSVNGHTFQRPNLPVYLPSNGALLAAVAMMAAGWRNGPTTHAPGFPKKGWQVRWENLLPL